MPEFDPDKYLAQSKTFDPDEYLKKNQSNATRRTPMNPLEAGLYKFNQGVTFGFADEIAGGLGAIAGEGAEALGFSEPKDIGQRYRETRDEQRRLVDQASIDQPYVGMGAEIAGSFASPVGLALAPAKTASALSNIGKVAAGGAVSGLGQSRSDITKGPSQFKEALKDTATGAALGAGVQAGMGAVSRVGQALAPEVLKKMANERAVKAAVGQNKKVYKDLVRTNQLQKTGADLLSADEFGAPAVGWLSKVEDIVPATKAKREAIGVAIGDVGKQIDSVVPNAVDGKIIASRLMQIMDDIPSTPKNESVRNAIAKEIEFYYNKGGMSFAEAQKLKGTYKFKPTDSTTQVLGQDATNAIRKAVSDEMEATVDKLQKSLQKDGTILMQKSKPGLPIQSDKEGLISSPLPSASYTPDLQDKLQLYQNLKKKYGSMATAAKAGEERELSNLSNRFVSPSDYAAGGVGGLAGVVTGGLNPASAAMAVGGAAANKFARERGSAFAARSLDAISNLINDNPQSLGKFRRILEDANKKGVQSLMLTHHLLSKDPDYRSIMNANEINLEE